MVEAAALTMDRRFGKWVLGLVVERCGRVWKCGETRVDCMVAARGGEWRRRLLRGCDGVLGRDK